MHMFDKLLTFAVAIALFLLGGGVYNRYFYHDSPHRLGGASSHVAGAQKYRDYSCHTCHGDDGRSPGSPAYPAVSGQSAQYTAAQIKDIRDGRRRNGLSGSMMLQILRVSDEDADQIAMYLSSLPR